MAYSNRPQAAAMAHGWPISASMTSSRLHCTVVLAVSFQHLFTEMRGLTVRQRMMATIRRVPCVHKMPAPGYRCHSDLAAPRHGSEERHEIPRLAWKIAYCNFFVEIRMRVSPALPHVQESFCCTGTMLSRFRSLLSSRRSVPKALSALRLFRVSIRAHEAVGGKGSSWQPSKIMRNDFQTASPTAAGCQFSSNSDVRLVT
jgi:hypothetical protein